MANCTDKIGKTRRLVTSVIAGLLACAFVVPLPPARAQAKESSINIVHQPITVEDLPYPGQPFPLVIQLTNTRSVTEKVQILAIIDGRSMQLPVSEAILDELDRAVYSVALPAPSQDIIYQFILWTQDGAIKTTQRYRVARECSPDTSAVKSEIDHTKPLGGQTELLFIEANKLEHELSTYDSINKTLDDIERLLKN